MQNNSPLDTVRHYHERTKHDFGRYARSLGYLDWATQPHPFRAFRGARRLPLALPSPPELPSSRDTATNDVTAEPSPAYDELFRATAVLPPAPLDQRFLSDLFFHSLALSAWKQVGSGASWSLRVNPSSGALHPTEGYLIVSPVSGLADTPAVYHYHPYDHALDERAICPSEWWERLRASWDDEVVFVGLTSIHWREAWKYGERSFRYCQHDVGHAIGAIAFAARALGWSCRVVDAVSDATLSRLLGTHTQTGPEAEHPDCLLALTPRPPLDSARPSIDEGLAPPFGSLDWQGLPNRLSREHHPWPILDEISAATWRATSSPLVSCDAASQAENAWIAPSDASATPSTRPANARRIIRQRRSAVDMDGRTPLDRADFFRLLERALPRSSTFPWSTWPYEPRISLALFVHRVSGLEPGLYALPRTRRHAARMRREWSAEFTWEAVAECPAHVPLARLASADCRDAAKAISCNQDIASDGAFACAMLAEFDTALAEGGPAAYPRLFWETGLIGQLLYLEAEAAGLRGTGIGCFFDDAVHRLLGIADRSWQSLYHFTIGGPVDDPRLQTLPAYAHLATNPAAHFNS